MILERFRTFLSGVILERRLDSVRRLFFAVSLLVIASGIDEYLNNYFYTRGYSEGEHMNATPNQEEPIYTYTIDQAEDDGILVQTSTLLPEHNGYQPHLISHITTTLLVEQGYFVQSEAPDKFGDPTSDYKRATIIDLLNIAGPKITTILAKNRKEWLVTTINIEGPNGQRFKAWAQLNEHGRWTLMLPEDH